MEPRDEFRAIYKRAGPHRRRCRFCGILIQSGASVVVQDFVNERYKKGVGIACSGVRYLVHEICWHKNRMMGGDDEDG